MLCLTRSDIENVFQEQKYSWFFPTGTKAGLVSILLWPGCDQRLNSWEKWSRERGERGWKDEGKGKIGLKCHRGAVTRRFSGISWTQQRWKAEIPHHTLFSGINIPFPGKIQIQHLHSQNLTFNQWLNPTESNSKRNWFPQEKPGSVGCSNTKLQTAPHVLEWGFPEYPNPNIPNILSTTIPWETGASLEWPQRVPPKFQNSSFSQNQVFRMCGRGWVNKIGF